MLTSLAIAWKRAESFESTLPIPCFFPLLPKSHPASIPIENLSEILWSYPATTVAPQGVDLMLVLAPAKSLFVGQCVF